jgi:transposase InsO family protein
MVGSSSPSPSMTAPAWPTPRSWPTRRPPPRSPFFVAPLPFYARYGVTIERLLTDNGSAYRSTVYSIACRALGVRHLRARPYRPQTNAKAERFIRTLLSGWAYGAIYRHGDQRTTALDRWLQYYNHHRQHSALGHKTRALASTSEPTSSGLTARPRFSSAGAKGEAARARGAGRRTNGRAKRGS